MADTILVVADLASDLIEAGRTMLRQLDAQGVCFDAAFWAMDPENGSWRLHLATPSLWESGSMELYRKVDEVLTELDFGIRFWIGMVTIEDMSSEIVRALVSALGAAASVDGTRLDNAPIAGTRIPACLVYRVTRQQPLGPRGNRSTSSPTHRNKPKAKHSVAA